VELEPLVSQAKLGSKVPLVELEIKALRAYKVRLDQLDKLDRVETRDSRD